eukprot:COSAG06_NODE_2909_length_6103_cov_502.645570_5_plen_177_part_00
MRPHRAHRLCQLYLAMQSTLFRKTHGRALFAIHVPRYVSTAVLQAKGQIPVICARRVDGAAAVRLRSAERGPAMAAASGSKASYVPVSQAEGTEDPSVYADDESEAPTKCVQVAPRLPFNPPLTGPALLLLTRRLRRAVRTGGRARRSSSGATASSPRFLSACSSSTSPGRWRSPR